MNLFTEKSCSWFQVRDVDWKDLKACVGLVLPLQCETRGCELTEESMESLLEATQHKVPLQELQVVYDQSGDFDQTALALEHLRWDLLNGSCARSLLLVASPKQSD